jgi:hypothetical protein
MSLTKTSKQNMDTIFTADKLKKTQEMKNARMNEWKNKKSNKDS